MRRGPGTPYPGGAEDFIKEVVAGGVGMMEVIAVYLKQQGAFVSRSLSFSSCAFELVEDSATPELRAM